MQVSMQYKHKLQVKCKPMFERIFEVGRSKISYQLGKLKEAGCMKGGGYEERLRASLSVRDELRARMEGELAKPGV